MNVGTPSSSRPPSKTIAASAPRSSASTHSTIGLTADLLLGVEREADVHRQLAGGGELARGLDEDEQLSLVVGDTACVEPAVALGELERRRLPEIERIRRLHVEVRVAEDGRARTPAARRPATSPMTSGRPPFQGTTSTEPPASRILSATHPAAATTSPA